MDNGDWATLLFLALIVVTELLVAVFLWWAHSAWRQSRADNLLRRRLGFPPRRRLLSRLPQLRLRP